MKLIHNGITKGFCLHAFMLLLIVCSCFREAAPIPYVQVAILSLSHGWLKGKGLATPDHYLFARLGQHMCLHFIAPGN